ncbi:hypothetical protein ACLOJK_017297 [Asimina triloba]
MVTKDEGRRVRSKDKRRIHPLHMGRIKESNRRQREAGKNRMERTGADENDLRVSHKSTSYLANLRK